MTKMLSASLVALSVLSLGLATGCGDSTSSDRASLSAAMQGEGRGDAGKSAKGGETEPGEDGGVEVETETKGADGGVEVENEDGGVEVEADGGVEVEHDGGGHRGH